ncbi:MAG: hypothetical protein U0572_09885 [Phycisphaerales bacterium]
MSTARRRFSQPLPTATVVAVAILVALASALADANGLSSVGARELDARVAARLVFPGRALATALSTVAEELAEGLRDDWTGGRRTVTAGSGGLSIAGLSAHAGLDLRPSFAALRGERFCDTSPASDDRAAIHRRLLNLPPPALAVRGA